MTRKQIGLMVFYLGLAAVMVFLAHDMVADAEHRQAQANIENCELMNEQRRLNNEERAVRRDYLIQYAHLLTMRAKTDAAHGDKALARQDLMLARNAMDWHAKIIDAELVNCDRLYNGG